MDLVHGLCMSPSDHDGDHPGSHLTASGLFPDGSCQGQAFHQRLVMELSGTKGNQPLQWSTPTSYKSLDGTHYPAETSAKS
jgi:hypothetical protein